MYLIIGASGFIGRHLYEYCKKNEIDVQGTYFTHSDYLEWIKFDICTDDLKELCHRSLKGIIPDAVILCGANASIDSCKKNADASHMLNVLGTKRVLRQADEMGIKTVFLSSEAVFDGKQGMYTETDIPNPVTLYGRQKLEIEQYIVENLKDFLVFRISRAVGSSFGEKDIFHEFYQKMMNQEEIICLKDQSFCLTEVDDIACGIVKALAQNVNGLYHLSSNNYISRYELAKLYAKRMFGGYERIIEKEYEDISFLDNRHIYGGLRGERLKNVLGINYMDTKNILDRYMESYERESKEEKIDD